MRGHNVETRQASNLPCFCIRSLCYDKHFFLLRFSPHTLSMFFVPHGMRVVLFLGLRCRQSPLGARRRPLSRSVLPLKREKRLPPKRDKKTYYRTITSSALSFIVSDTIRHLSVELFLSSIVPHGMRGVLFRCLCVADYRNMCY